MGREGRGGLADSWWVLGEESPRYWKLRLWESSGVEAFSMRDCPGMEHSGGRAFLH